MNVAPRKQFAFDVLPKTHEAVSRRAKELGQSPTAYAKMLFEAGFAARIGQERDAPLDDTELDEQVRLVFACAGQGNTASIAKSIGVPEARVVKILDGWRKLGRRA